MPRARKEFRRRTRWGPWRAARSPVTTDGSALGLETACVNGRQYQLEPAAPRSPEVGQGQQKNWPTSTGWSTPIPIGLAGDFRGIAKLEQGKVVEGRYLVESC
jgi:hypothetical protein